MISLQAEANLLILSLEQSVSDLPTNTRNEINKECEAKYLLYVFWGFMFGVSLSTFGLSSDYMMMQHNYLELTGHREGEKFSL